MQARKFKPLYFLSLSILLLNVACSSKDENSDLTAYVIDRETFTALLTDIHLIEASLVRKQSVGSFALDLPEIYYDSLFAKHAVTRTMLDSSLAYYSRRPDVFDGIYVNVITNLSKKASEPLVLKDEELKEEVPEPETETVDQTDEPVEEEIVPHWFRVKENPWVN
jgi:hypothetical protein